MSKDEIEQSLDTLLSKVEDDDVIVQGVQVELRVNNNFFHLDVQLRQVSFALLFPLVFSKCDLI